MANQEEEAMKAIREKPSESFNQLTDAVYALYRNRAFAVVMSLFNAIVCVYSFYVLAITGYAMLAVIPLVCFCLNLMYVYSLIRNAFSDNKG